MKELSAEHAKKIMETVNYITIATVDENGQPWNSPVFRGYDDQFNFYWASWKENQHSKNIATNPRVFLSIYDSTQAPGTGFGVYVLAVAGAMDNPDEMKDALEHYYGRRGIAARDCLEFLGDYPRRFYKATPIKFWMNDVGKINGNHIDKRVEIKLL